MEKAPSIKRNMIMNIVLTVSNTLFPILTYSYVARMLQPQGVGKVSFVTSAISYFSWIALLGIPVYGLRECSKKSKNKEKLSKLVHELLIINIISTAIAYILLALSVICINKFRLNIELFIIMSSSLLLTTMGVEWLYQALEKYDYITKRSLIFKVFSVILTFLLIKSPEDYLIYGGLTIFTTSASNICNFINLRKYIIIKPIGGINLKQHIRPIVTLFTATIMISIYGNLDVLMIGFLKDDSAVGMYNSAMKIRNIVASLSAAITAVLIPRITSYYQSGNKEKFLMLLEKSLRISCILAFPLTAYIILNARDVILFLCGPQYLGATTTLIILMFCVYALIFTNLFGNQMLIPMGFENRFTQSVFWGMIINLL